MTSSAGEKSVTIKKKGGFVSAFKTVVIVILLIVGAGAGGYFFGTQQQFAPIQKVPPGTQGAVPQSSLTPSPSASQATTASASPSAATAPASAATAATSGIPQLGQAPLKSKYWIHVDSDNTIGLIIVTVNGQLIDSSTRQGKNLDITSAVKPGENRVTFEVHNPASSTASHQNIDLQVLSGPTMVANPSPSEGHVLLKYFHNATSQQASDTLTFSTQD